MKEEQEDQKAKTERLMEFMSPLGLGLDWNYLEGLQASDISELIKMGKVNPDCFYSNIFKGRIHSFIH